MASVTHTDRSGQQIPSTIQICPRCTVTQAANDADLLEAVFLELFLTKEPWKRAIAKDRLARQFGLTRTAFRWAYNGWVEYQWRVAKNIVLTDRNGLKWVGPDSEGEYDE